MHKSLQFDDFFDKNFKILISRDFDIFTEEAFYSKLVGSPCIKVGSRSLTNRCFGGEKSARTFYLIYFGSGRQRRRGLIQFQWDILLPCTGVRACVLHAKRQAAGGTTTILCGCFTWLLSLAPTLG